MPILIQNAEPLLSILNKTSIFPENYQAEKRYIGNDLLKDKSGFSGSLSAGSLRL